MITHSWKVCYAVYANIHYRYQVYSKLRKVLPRHKDIKGISDLTTFQKLSNLKGISDLTTFQKLSNLQL